MKENRAKGNFRFLNDVFGLLADSSEQSVDDVVVELRADGVDVHAALNRLMAKVQAASLATKKTRLATARERRLQDEAQRERFVGKFRNLEKRALLAELRDLMAGPDTGLAFSWRELESRTEEDLRALLEDLALARHDRAGRGDGGET